MTNSSRGGGRIVGLGLLALGVLFLIENFTDWNIPWGGWWPLILVLWGLWSLLQRGSGWVGGSVLIVVGGLFLLDTQDVWEYGIGDIWRLWPVVLVLIGARILFARRKKSSRSSSHQRFEDRSEAGDLNITSVFGTNQRKVTDQALEGGEVTAVFGSVEIDLRDAALAGGEASLEITAVFGGAAIRIPHNWSVDQQVTTMLGGVSDQRDSASSTGSAGQLTLTGFCLFGGIELKN